MSEIRFLHVERISVERALAGLLRETMRPGLKIVIEGPEEILRRLDDNLWTFAEDSFLPHGLATDVDAQRQPILLRNAGAADVHADLRVLLGGCALEPRWMDEEAGGQIAFLFNGDDAAELAAARAQWAQLKAAGRELAYWRQDQDGRWVRAR